MDEGEEAVIGKENRLVSVNEDGRRDMGDQGLGKLALLLEGVNQIFQGGGGAIEGLLQIPDFTGMAMRDAGFEVTDAQSFGPFIEPLKGVDDMTSAQGVADQKQEEIEYYGGDHQPQLALAQMIDLQVEGLYELVCPVGHQGAIDDQVVLSLSVFIGGGIGVEKGSERSLKPVPLLLELMVLFDELRRAQLGGDDLIAQLVERSLEVVDRVLKGLSGGVWLVAELVGRGHHLHGEHALLAQIIEIAREVGGMARKNPEEPGDTADADQCQEEQKRDTGGQRFEVSAQHGEGAEGGGAGHLLLVNSECDRMSITGILRWIVGY